MSVKKDPVVRDERGRLSRGSAPINPGGLTALEREARDAVRQALSGELRGVGLAAYRRCLEADNPVIVKDFMDRVAGKVKERVELSSDPDAPLNPMSSVTLEELKAIARAQLDKEVLQVPPKVE